MIRAPWVSHFGFTHTPFSKTIPASQLCERASLQEAVARIQFTVAEALLGVLTGEVGVGKTVAVRAATAQLDPTSHHVIYVSNPAFGTPGLYVTLVRSLGAVPRFHKAELIAQAQSLLAAEEQERRRRVVLIVDEAHLLSPEQLEEIRLLTNAEMDAVNPFALLLVGQPTLARQLRLGIFAALDQRISMRYQITAMDLRRFLRTDKQLPSARETGCELLQKPAPRAHPPYDQLRSPRVSMPDGIPLHRPARRRG